MFANPHPDVVIIGGGILGCAIARYLSRQPGVSVTVIERHGLGEQTTSQAAALLTRIRPYRELTAMAMETFHAIDELGEQTGEPLPLRRVGSLQVAAESAGRQQIERTAARAADVGVVAERLDADTAQQRAPWLSLSGDTAALWLPDDGYIDPYSLCQAYAADARRRGVSFRLRQTVAELRQTGNRVTGVRLASGETVTAGLVIDAAGPWSTALARQVGVHLGMAPVRSHYWISAAHPAIPADGPMTILPDSGAYARPEVGGLLFGLRDPQAVTAHPGQLPASLQDFCFDQDPNGDAALEAGYHALRQQLPLVDELPLAHYVSNVSSYTPDGFYLLGAMPAVEGFMAATGCSGAGIGMSGGIGRLVAELASGQAPFVDPDRFRLDRFGSIDSYHPDFIHRCAEARARKRTG
ncbi:NAD(P)/FAD-dependent oxidoreductase [Marinobacter xestospongiae]|uniref:FAD-dependent oxidoreductase n=1 Tax=Marinobacter xestospongiae TaxID=994319 RepID=A0ABU3W2R7_9GAMM|nr:FAD-dependent oxidoreductase [Marinobacter xestospongiae]MDV2080834.1 FAD-dependent oxidoreductase [Marinobacter xestospongiae]